MVFQIEKILHKKLKNSAANQHKKFIGTTPFIYQKNYKKLFGNIDWLKE